MAAARRKRKEVYGNGELHRDYPDVPVIAISGGSRTMGMDMLTMARQFGARRAFGKPFDLAEMLEAVRAELEDRRAA